MSTIWNRIRLTAALSVALFAIGCASAPKPVDLVASVPEFHDAPIGADSLRSYIEAQ